MKEIRKALMQFDREAPLEIRVALLERFTDALLERQPSEGTPDLDESWQDHAPDFLLRLMRRKGSTWQTLVGFHSLLASPLPVEGGIAFCAESQGCHYWGFRQSSAEADPMVCFFGKQKSPRPKLKGFDILRYLRELAWYDSKQPGPPPPRDESRLSEFLFQLLVFEAAYLAPYNRGLIRAAPEVISAMLEGFQALPLAPWSWPAHPSRFYQSDSAFAFATTYDDGTLNLTLGFDDEAGLRQFEAAHPGIEWDSVMDPEAKGA